jgi:hypothetical protein
MQSPSSPQHHPPGEAPSRRSCGLWALGCLGTFGLLVLLAALSVAFYFRGRQQQALRAVQAEIDRIHAAGEPITTEDMVKFHRVPDGTFDATQLWIDAIETAASIKVGNEASLPIVGEGQLDDLRADAPQSPLPMAEQLLAAHAETIDKTRQAAAAGGECRYPVDFSQGINALLPHIQDARGLTRILSLRLHVAVENGDVATALESLELQLALAQTMEHEPTLIAQLVRISVIQIGLTDLRALLGALPLSEPQLARLQTRLAAVDAHGPVKNGLLGERAMGFHTFHHLSQLEGMELLAGEDGQLQRPGDCALYLDLMRESVEAADQPPREARLAAAQIEDRVRSRLATKNPLDRLEVVGTMLLFPATTGALDATARAQATCDAAIAAIAFRRYQLEHQRPPESLESLVPEFLSAVPLDPFAAGNSPLKLVIDGDQFAIYSVGANLQDDKALLRDPESTDDLGFVAPLAVPQETSTVDHD